MFARAALVPVSALMIGVGCGGAAGGAPAPPAPPAPPAASASVTAFAAPHSHVGIPDAQQRFADLGTCALESGQRIDGCRVGYRTFGTLDASKSNAILFPTWFT